MTETTAAPGSAGAGTVTAWERVKLARHAERPHTLDYLNALTTDWIELHCDRAFGDDLALIGGLASFDGQTVMVLGHQKGNDTKENISRNFGMARPEGYRKAERLMRHAEKFGFPVITFIDTPGAEPGIGSEERGQATAIAESLLTMADIGVPTIAVVIGEGGSGGALAIGVGDRVLMQEHAIHSVISPEGCAAILWKDASQRERAAEALKITAEDLLRLKIIDEIVKEPEGGAHVDPDAAGEALREALIRHVTELRKIRPEKLIRRRADKYGAMGAFSDA
jgi:acetyl-CoA carboxylase carboxyl transferase subunit alpha